MGVTLDFDDKLARRELARIGNSAIPRAKAAAFARAGATVSTKVATEVAARAAVPKWMVLGIGGAARSRGGRLGRTGYLPGFDGIKVFLRHSQINPVGTKAKLNPVTVTRRRKSAKAIKAGAGSRPTQNVRAAGRLYQGAYFAKGPYTGGIYLPQDGQPRGQLQTISLDPWAAPILLAVASTVGTQVFADRFRHELSRRLKGQVE